MQVAAELAARRLPPHGSDDPIADDQRTDVAPPRFRDELLQKDLLPQVPEGPEDALHLGRAVRDHHADALRALDQLEDRRKAAHLRDQVANVAAAAREHGARDAHTGRGQLLQGRQLVAAARDRRGIVEQRYTHGLEVAHDREADRSHRSADPRHRDSQTAYLLALVIEARALRFEREIAAEHIDHAGAEPTCVGRFDQSPRGVERLLAGEDDKRRPPPRTPDLLDGARHLRPPAWTEGVVPPLPAALRARTACKAPHRRRRCAPCRVRRDRRRRRPAARP